MSNTLSINHEGVFMNTLCSENVWRWYNIRDEKEALRIFKIAYQIDRNYSSCNNLDQVIQKFVNYLKAFYKLKISNHH